MKILYGIKNSLCYFYEDFGRLIVPILMMLAIGAFSIFSIYGVYAYDEDRLCSENSLEMVRVSKGADYIKECYAGKWHKLHRIN